jgi:hypothetical protein
MSNKIVSCKKFARMLVLTIKIESNQLMGCSRYSTKAPIIQLAHRFKS